MAKPAGKGKKTELNLGIREEGRGGTPTRGSSRGKKVGPKKCHQKKDEKVPLPNLFHHG